MKWILFLILPLLLFGCSTETAPAGYMFLVQTKDGQVFYTTHLELSKTASGVPRYTIKPQAVEIRINEQRPKIYLVEETNPLILMFRLGYKQGQIDTHINRLCWIKILTDNGEIMYKDTCIQKVIPNLNLK